MNHLGDIFTPFNFYYHKFFGSDRQAGFILEITQSPGTELYFYIFVHTCLLISLKPKKEGPKKKL